MLCLRLMAFDHGFVDAILGEALDIANLETITEASERDGDRQPIWPIVNGPRLQVRGGEIHIGRRRLPFGSIQQKPASPRIEQQTQ